MTDFLTRMANRAVLPAARASTDTARLEPLTTLRGMSPAEPVGLVEEQVDVIAPQPTRAPSPPFEVDPSPSPGPIQASPPEVVEPQSAEPAESTPVLEPLQPVQVAQPEATRPPSSTSVDGPVSDAGRRVAELSPVEAAAAPRQPRPARSDLDPMQTTEPPRVTARLAPQIESVIEVHRVAGPVVPVARHALPAPSDRTESREPAPPAPQPTTPVEAERTLVFLPQEPLERLGLAPLALDDISTAPQVAQVAGPDSVIHVHIGRLEVSRPAPPYVPPPPPKPSGTLSLDSYLAERTAAAGGRRS